jgi:FlaA1/EpsC-like NDP-sugar epimerase
MPTEHPRIMKAHENFKTWSELEKELDALQELLNCGDAQAIYKQLKLLVTGFTPDTEIVDWIASK